MTILNGEVCDSRFMNSGSSLPKTNLVFRNHITHEVFSMNSENANHNDEDEEEKDSERWIELAKLSQESFLNRRSYEWKVAFGFWTAIGVITYFGAMSEEKVKAAGWVYCLIPIYFIVGLSWLFLWQAPMRRAFQKDQDFKHYYMEKAEGRTPDRPSSDLMPYWEAITGRQGVWTWAQTVFTWCVLLFSLMVLLYVKDGSEKSKQSIEIQAGNDLKIKFEK